MLKAELAGAEERPEVKSVLDNIGLAVKKAAGMLVMEKGLPRAMGTFWVKPRRSASGLAPSAAEAVGGQFGHGNE